MKSSINGFPELLPEEQILMNSWVEGAKHTYESYGYVPIETCAVESVETLLAKWSDDKEIYWISRYVDVWEQEFSSPETKAWLHFDLTIPFARYTSTHFNNITFPFKRYQIQKCWRGERPQLGRYREFLQSDIDVIWNGALPLHFDSEVLEIAIKALNGIVRNQYEIFFNNRKIFDWLCDFYGISEDKKTEMVKTVDKLDKIWKEACKELLIWLEIPNDLIDFLVSTETAPLDIDEIKRIFNPYNQNSKIQEALQEIEDFIWWLSEESKEVVRLKINLARWLNYYTWSIFEWRLKDYPSLSICGGWRYENLVDTIWWKKLPGVWISLWMTRIFWILEHLKRISATKKTNTQVLIGWFNEVQRTTANKTANILRGDWVNTEVYHDFSHKPSKQIKYALSKWINHILFISEDETLSLKKLDTWEQTSISNSDISTHFK